ncbi:MAG: hypothetical protein EPO67_11165 [Reyranella sp.]|jgi:hypothetical protein|nr:MAG: hypothetical protein EPO67_11165 [Reyranella sp.]
MPRKLLALEPAKLAALELLAADRGDSLQELLDEAIDGLLKKHRRPVTTREMFSASARTVRRQRPRPRRNPA